jgi:hypothetical protein
MSAKRGGLFDQLIGCQLQRRRDADPKLLGRSCVNGQREFGWLLDREVSRLSSLDDLARIDASFARAGSYLFFEENAYHVTDRTRTKHPEPRQPWNQLLEKADALLSDGVLSAKSVEHIPRYHSARSGGVALSESTLNRVHSYPGEHGRGGGLQVADCGETSTHDKHCRG